jgi:hypothetical protein
MYNNLIRNNLPYNYIGIDLSLTSAAISIFNKNGYRFLSYMKNWEKPTKWTKNLLDHVKITGVKYRISEDYSEQENYKIEDYRKNVETIINDIKNCIVDGDIAFAIEGYSYNSETSSIIDLVTMSTFLRDKLKTELNAKMYVYSPSTLKLQTCGLVYGWSKSGVKTIKYTTRNTDGMAGGNFKKREMMKALNDYPCDSNLSKFIKENYNELYKMSNIPPPIPDLVDSYWLLKVLMNDKIFHMKKIIN